MNFDAVEAVSGNVCGLPVVSSLRSLNRSVALGVS